MYLKQRKKGNDLVDKKVNIKVTTQGAKKAEKSFKDIGASMLSFGVRAAGAAVAVAAIGKAAL